MASSTESKSFATFMAFALAAFSASTAFSVYLWKRKSRVLDDKIFELEKAAKILSDKCAAERQGRIRAQQALRKELAQPNVENSGATSYPMAPIGIIKSCFSTRNGTPRQPLLVPLAKARLFFNLSRVPPASLEGLREYSHCWVLYIFHLNTDLEKLWKDPAKSKFKAKVRVPRLKGGKMGVFATRSPHRPCPIGLTVAKEFDLYRINSNKDSFLGCIFSRWKHKPQAVAEIEAVQGNLLLLSGVDLVDGTPVLDIKPYIPYCDSVQGATVPNWLMEDSLLAVASVSFSKGFSSTLADCWEKAGKNSLYASPDEFQSLIKQVLSWDIRSVSQRNRPHDSLTKTENGENSESAFDPDDPHDEELSDDGSEQSTLSSGEIVYHLILEGLDVSYRIDFNGNVVVERVSVSNHLEQ